mmetsp:Transcript_55843/g.141416  ORF Transcript_55843/g.141416 Transcript_55843/m.141416 type:complete len:674 (+) Transcript_55843:69-2090(+)
MLPVAVLAYFLVAVVLPDCAWSQQSEEEIKSIADSHPGCFFAGWEYKPAIPGAVVAPTLQTCQLLCEKNASCTVFTYWQANSSCSFSGDGAMRTKTTSLAVAGHGVCPPPTPAPPAACSTELPGNGFPSWTIKSSNAAWPSGKQPKNLECWPTTWIGKHRPCDKVHVIEDTKVGWPGKCRDLKKVSGIRDEARCSALCRTDPKCPSWQLAINTSCFHGLGVDCYVRDFTPVAAQRLLHGNVRKLMDLTGWQILGLSRIFLDDNGYFGDQQDAIKACRKSCYSDIHCQYWQYSPKFGCWVEDATKSYAPPYPLTLDWAYRTTPFAADCVAGEMIQHICPAEAARKTSSSSNLDCATRGARYEPAAGTWSDTTVSVTASQCQKACARQPQCAFFSFWSKGRCERAGPGARLVAAQTGVLAGPRSCSETPTTSTSVPPSATPAPSTPTAGVDEHSRVKRDYIYMVGMNFTIHNVQYGTLGLQHRSLLESKFVETLADQLEVKQKEIMNMPEGTPKTVRLEGRHGPETFLLAWTQNRPSDSSDTSELKAIIMSPQMAAALELAVGDVVHLGNEAIMGHVLVSANPIKVEAHPAPEAERGWWERWWPFFLLLLLIAGAIFSFGGCIMWPGQEKDSDMDYGENERVGFTDPWSTQSRAREYGQSGLRRYLPKRQGEFTV